MFYSVSLKGFPGLNCESLAEALLCCRLLLEYCPLDWVGHIVVIVVVLSRLVKGHLFTEKPADSESVFVLESAIILISCNLCQLHMWIIVLT